jgi:predicted DsbA family dithiol-disulfide isomerase
MRAIEPLKYMARKYPNDVQVVFKHYPLDIHRLAFDQAVASLAAARQNKFWEFVDTIFQRRRADTSVLLSIASDLGLDMFKFNQDFNSQELRDQVTYEKNLAEQLGFTGTPGFFIAGDKTAGWASYEYIHSKVVRALKEKDLSKNCLTPDIGCD